MLIRALVILLGAVVFGGLALLAMQQFARTPSPSAPGDAATLPRQRPAVDVRGAVAATARADEPGPAPDRKQLQGTAPQAAATPTLPAAPAGGAVGQLVIPVAGVRAAQLTDSFGDLRGGSRPHEALDIAAPAGTPVLAVADGHVEKLFDSERGGLTLYQFDLSGRYAYYYAHLQGYAPGLREGQRLRRGQVIAYVGSSGNANPGAPHLHFAVFMLEPAREWWRGTPVNPYPLLGGN